MPSLADVHVTCDDLDAVVARLQSDERELQCRALVELRKLSRERGSAQAALAAGVLPRVVLLAAADDARVQENCASVINNVTSFSVDGGAAVLASNAVGAILPLLASPHFETVRLCAVRALRTICRTSRHCANALHAQGALPLLLRLDAFDHRSVPARAELQQAVLAAIVDLLAQGPSAHVERVFQFVHALTEHSNHHVVAEAVALITRQFFAFAHDAAVLRVRALLEHESESVRAEAAQTLFYFCRTHGVALLIKHDALRPAVQIIERAETLESALTGSVMRMLFAASSTDPPAFPGVAALVAAGFVPAVVRHSLAWTSPMRSVAPVLTNLLFQSDETATNEFVRSGIVVPLVQALLEVVVVDDVVHRAKAGISRVLITASPSVLREALDAPNSIISFDALASAIHVTTAGNRDALTLAVFRRRAATVCFALQELELPALVTLEILDAAVANAIPMHTKWEVIVAVKHFRERNERSRRKS